MMHVDTTVTWRHEEVCRAIPKEQFRLKDIRQWTCIASQKAYVAISHDPFDSTGQCLVFFGRA